VSAELILERSASASAPRTFAWVRAVRPNPPNPPSLRAWLKIPRG